jgi:hypothetical protein
VLTIIESGSQAWALAAADGDLHIYAREEAGEWTEMLLSEDAEQIDQDGSSILEALYEQYATTHQNGQTTAQDDEEDEPQDEEPLEDEEDPEDEEEPEDEVEAADEDEEPADEQDDQEMKPRRSRTRARSKKK